MEHILPQKPAAGSGWDNTFTIEEQEEWLHRLGNLALLHGKLNVRAANRSFKEKKEKYRQDNMQWLGSAVLPLTDAVTKLQHWGPAEARARQEEQVKLAAMCWCLHGVEP